MSQKTFKVPNISCHHCVSAIKNELSELKGVKIVTGDPEKKEIFVEWEEPASEKKIRGVLQDISYPADKE